VNRLFPAKRSRSACILISRGRLIGRNVCCIIHYCSHSLCHSCICRWLLWHLASKPSQSSRELHLHRQWYTNKISFSAKSTHLG
jgi:hypothetical protein